MIPHAFDALATVSALRLYPVKACAGMPVDHLLFDELGGPVGDRCWAVVNPDGAVTWQGEHARLSLVHPLLTADTLRLSSPGHPDVAVPLALRGVSRAITLWNEKTSHAEAFDAQDGGEEAAAWLSQVVGAPLRLVLLGPAARARGAAHRVHLIAQASAAEVDDWLAAAGQAAANPWRYRPNVILAGDSPAFEEEHWAALHGPASRIDITASCVRCAVTNVDPRDASVTPSTLQALVALSARRQPGRPVSFGVYGRGVPGGLLRLGDPVGAALDL